MNVGRLSHSSTVNSTESHKLQKKSIIHMWESSQSILTNSDFSYVQSNRMALLNIDLPNVRRGSLVSNFFFKNSPSEFEAIRSTWVNEIQDNILTVRDHEIQDIKSQRLANGFKVRFGQIAEQQEDVYSYMFNKAKSYTFRIVKSSTGPTCNVDYLLSKNFSNTATISVKGRSVGAFRRKYLQQPVLLRDYIQTNATTTEYPILGMLKRTVEVPFYYAIKDSYGYAKTIKQKSFQEFNQLQALHEQYYRHPLTQSKYIKKHLLSTTSYSGFTKFNIVKNIRTSVAAFFKTI